MAKGKKTGGRRAGTPNRRTVLEDVLREVDPSDGLVYFQTLHTIAVGAHTDIRAKIAAASKLIEHKWGTPVARHEISGPEGKPIEVHDHFAVRA